MYQILVKNLNLQDFS